MTLDLFGALVLYAFVNCATPGPNNLMLMASGLNFGLGRTWSHIAGIFCGFVSMIGLVGLGLAQLYESFGWLELALKGSALAYMLWLAYKLASAAPPSGAIDHDARPLTFFQAASFQWVNPKAWGMAIGAHAAFAPGGDALSVLIVTATFASVNVPIAVSWVLLGTRLTRLLQSPKRLKAFNYTMAALLLLSILPVLAS